MSDKPMDPGLFSLNTLCRKIAKVVPPENVIPRNIEDPTSTILLRSRLKSIREGKEDVISRARYFRRGVSCGYDPRNSAPSSCLNRGAPQSHLHTEPLIGTCPQNQRSHSEDSTLYSSSHFTEDPVEFSEETSKFTQALMYPGALANEEEELALLTAAVSRHRVAREGVSQRGIKSLPPLSTDRKLILTMDNIERGRAASEAQRTLSNCLFRFPK